MLKPENVTTKGRVKADAEPTPAPAASPDPVPAGPPQRCVLCGGPCHVVRPAWQPYETQDCPSCGLHRRDPEVARRAFPENG